MSLAVIGAGFGRTGTLSLKLALEQLGFGPCYHMIEVVRSPERGQHWIDAAEGRAVDWNTVFAGYRATVDWPACDYWRELTRAFPDAKVILSIRDPESWYRSAQNTIFSQWSRDRVAANPHMLRILRAIAEHNFAGSLSDKDGLIAAFNRHNAAVQSAIPAERLLVYQADEGWEPLCRFLGVTIPSEAYPAVNTTEEFQARGVQPRL